MGSWLDEKRKDPEFEREFQKARGEVAEGELDIERKQHAACLHIAEGHKGWERAPFSTEFPDSEAMRAVRKLRRQMLDARKQAQIRGWNQA